MSGDLVRNERHAVQTLRTAVTRFAEHLRESMAQARKDLASQHRKADEAVEQSRNKLQRAERDLHQARQALARCRENCGGLEAAVVHAAQQAAVCKLELETAQRAAQMIATAEHELSGVLRAVEAKVGQTGSVAAAALADLANKLAALPSSGTGAVLRRAAKSAIVTTEVAGALITSGGMMADALHAAGVDAPGGNATLSEMVDHQDQNNQQYVLEETEKRSRRRVLGDWQEGD